MSKFRGGLVPEKVREQSFAPVTTKDVENYLRNKFNAINALMRQKGYKPENVSIELVSITPGEKFAPFMAFFSTNIDIKWDEKFRSDTDIEPIFEMDHYEDDDEEYKSHIIPEYAALIEQYSYSKEDESWLMDRDFQRDMKIPAKYLIKNMLKYRRPVVSMKNDCIMVILDPVRIFFDMMKDETYNPNIAPNWHVRINSYKEIKDGQISYRISKVPNGKNRKNKKGNRNNNNYVRSIANSLSAKRR